MRRSPTARTFLLGLASPVLLTSVLLGGAGTAEAQITSGPPAPSAIEGRLWNDLNGNGWLDRHERGLAGVTIYSDLNDNGRLDRDEPSAISRRDDPRTAPDETGEYSIGVSAGEHLLRLVNPPDSETTWPSGGHLVSVGLSHIVSGIDFGVATTTVGRVTGLVWTDSNRDGVRDDDEPGLPGVTVYVDLNRNCLNDRGDLVAVSAEDDPATLADEAGQYWLVDVPPGHFPIRIEQPLDAFPTAPLDGLHEVYVPLDDGVSGVDFGLAVSAPFLTVSTDRLDIEPTDSLSTVASFDVSIAPACVLPYQLEAVASDRWALFEDLDGLQQNGCFGDTTTFSMEFRSTAAVQCYQVLVRDPNFDTILTSLAVRVPEPATGLALVVGTIGLGGAARIRRRPLSRGDHA